MQSGLELLRGEIGRAAGTGVERVRGLLMLLLLLLLLREVLLLLVLLLLRECLLLGKFVLRHRVHKVPVLLPADGRERLGRARRSAVRGRPRGRSEGHAWGETDGHWGEVRVVTCLVRVREWRELRVQGRELVHRLLLLLLLLLLLELLSLAIERSIKVVGRVSMR